MGKALEAAGNEVAFDRSYFDRDQSRNYVLDRFDMPVKFSKRCGAVLGEGDLTYHPEFIKKYAEDVTLDGYWQCKSYWAGIEDQIRKSLSLRYIPNDKTLVIAKQIKQSKNSTFLHIRRTDAFATRALAFHAICPPDYYKRAIQFITERVGELSLLVFSDDIEWCKHNLNLPATFVDCNKPGVYWDEDYNLTRNADKDEQNDLWLGSLCDNAIISNSSFAWWASYLWNMRSGPKENIVAPKVWFVGKNNEMSRDICPLEWHRI